MGRYWIVEIDEDARVGAEPAVSAGRLPIAERGDRSGQRAGSGPSPAELAAAVMRALGRDETPPGSIVEAPLVGERLSPRERDVLRLVARGQATKQVARELGLCERTVKFHVGSAMNKLGAENRTHAAVLATQLGVLAS